MALFVRRDPLSGCDRQAPADEDAVVGDDARDRRGDSLYLVARALHRALPRRVARHARRVPRVVASRWRAERLADDIALIAPDRLGPPHVLGAARHPALVRVPLPARADRSVAPHAVSAGASSRTSPCPEVPKPLQVAPANLTTAMAREKEVRRGSVVGYDYIDYLALLWNNDYSNKVLWLLVGRSPRRGRARRSRLGLHARRHDAPCADYRQPAVGAHRSARGRSDGERVAQAALSDARIAPHERVRRLRGLVRGGPSLERRGERRGSGVLPRLQARVPRAQGRQLGDGPLLDFGCGIGNLTERFVTRCREVHAYDPSARSLERAKERAPGAHFHDDAKTLPKAHFATAVLSGVLHHVQPSARRRARCARCAGSSVRAGGIVVFEHNPLNPVTRRAVAACAFDDDAILLWPWEARGVLAAGRLRGRDARLHRVLPARARLPAAARAEAATRDARRAADARRDEPAGLRPPNHDPRSATALLELRSDDREVDAGAHPRRRGELRACHVRPASQRHLEEIPGVEAGKTAGADQQPSQELHVEDRPRMKRLGDGGAEEVRVLEELRAALRVVEARAQDQRGDRREGPSEVVAARLADRCRFRRAPRATPSPPRRPSPRRATSRSSSSGGVARSESAKPTSAAPCARGVLEAPANRLALAGVARQRSAARCAPRSAAASAVTIAPVWSVEPSSTNRSRIPARARARGSARRRAAAPRCSKGRRSPRLA